MDPRKASRSHFDKVFFSHVQNPFKQVVFDYPCYEDYIRNTTIFYDAMCAFYSRIVPGGKHAAWLEDPGRVARRAERHAHEILAEYNDELARRAPTATLAAPRESATRSAAAAMPGPVKFFPALLVGSLG